MRSLPCSATYRYWPSGLTSRPWGWISFPLPVPRPPKLVISDAVRKPDSLRAAVRDLWNLAYGPPQVVTVTRWRELEPYFERVRQAHADGKWHFVLPEAPVAATAGSVA